MKGRILEGIAIKTYQKVFILVAGIVILLGSCGLLLAECSDSGITHIRLRNRIHVEVDEQGNVSVQIMRNGGDMHIFQQGFYNFLFQSQDDASNELSTYQHGAFNFASIEQEGSDNIARQYQVGSGNKAVIKQSAPKETED